LKFPSLIRNARRRIVPPSKQTSLRRYWRLLYKYLRPQGKRVALLAVLLLSSIALKVANPQIIGRFIDAALGGDSAAMQSLSIAAVLFLVLAVVIQALSVSATYVGENVGWHATNQLRADLMLYCLKLDMWFHNERTPGEMIERVDGDVFDLAIFFSQFIVQILGNLLLVVGVLIALYAEDWRIGAALTIYALGALWGMNRIREVAVPHWKAARDASTDQFGFIEEQLAGTEDIRANGAEAYSMRNLFRFDRERLYKERKAGFVSTLVVWLWIGLYGLGRVIAFVGGFFLVTQNVITVGVAYLIVYYTDAIFRPLREITNQIQNLQKAGGSIARIDELYQITSKIQEKNQVAALPSGPLSVTFENVTFTYFADKPPVFEGLNIEIRPGHVLGLLGRTGSGKTTIARLLFRLYDVTGGAIRVGSQDIRDVALSDLQSHVGLVTQDVQLFRASVRNNLTFFDQSIADETIERVLVDLGLGDWLARLPNGLDTELESGGRGLSAGEGQLLAFTRVFLKNPGLVILDEASSRLDPATEQLIERAIDKLLANRTGIIIAHRLATIQRVDEVLILEDGHIAEYGTYHALTRDPDSRLSDLLRTGMTEVLA
jgi:ABC-type multidrug transport system fused ATPase/permease subunit